MKKCKEKKVNGLSVFKLYGCLCTLKTSYSSRKNYVQLCQGLTLSNCTWPPLPKTFEFPGGECHGEGDRWHRQQQHQARCYFSQVKDAKQRLNYSGRLQWQPSLSCVISQRSTNESNNRPWTRPNETCDLHPVTAHPLVCLLDTNYILMTSTNF